MQESQMNVDDNISNHIALIAESFAWPELPRKPDELADRVGSGRNDRRHINLARRRGERRNAGRIIQT